LCNFYFHFHSVFILFAGDGQAIYGIGHPPDYSASLQEMMAFLTFQGIGSQSG
jgi:hypothetical protein